MIVKKPLTIKNVVLNDHYKNQFLESKHWDERESPASHYYTLIKENYPFNFSLKPKLLDVGCSSGTEVYEFSRLGFQAYGLDCDEVAIKYAKIKFPELEFTSGKAENIPYYDNSFDVLLSIHTLFFVEISEAIPEFHRVLKPGGLMILTFDESIIDLDNNQIIYQLPLKNLEKKLTCGQILYKEYKERIDMRPFKHQHKYYEILYKIT